TETLNSFQFEGNTIIEGAVINTYENQPVIKHGKYSRVKLPVAPLLLPGGLGVFSVCEYGNPENEFIYIPMGVFNMFKKEKLLSPMQINFYSFDNEYVIVYSDLISAGISSVDLKICSMDIDNVGQFDMLPIEQ